LRMVKSKEHEMEQSPALAQTKATKMTNHFMLVPPGGQ
jgi:hypothetical protein